MGYKEKFQKIIHSEGVRDNNTSYSIDPEEKNNVKEQSGSAEWEKGVQEELKHIPNASRDKAEKVVTEKLKGNKKYYTDLITHNIPNKDPINIVSIARKLRTKN